MKRKGKERIDSWFFFTIILFVSFNLILLYRDSALFFPPLFDLLALIEIPSLTLVPLIVFGIKKRKRKEKQSKFMI